MQKKKGEYGYRNSSRHMRLLLTLAFIAAILAQLLARKLTDNQSARNILTVMAVLTVLPMANIAAPMLASWKYKTPPERFHQKAAAYEASFLILYDLVLTSKEAVMPMDAIAVHPRGIIAYLNSPKADCRQAEKFLNEMLTANKLDSGVKVISEEHAFFHRLDSLKPASEYGEDESLPYVAALLKSLSM